MTNKNTRRGFTLIELLVVVLIIGILAAVAVPQYQFAVDKTRVSPYLATISSIIKAEQIYFLKNGAFSTNLTQLDIDFTSVCKLVTGTQKSELGNCTGGFSIQGKWDDKPVEEPISHLGLRYCQNATQNCFSSTPNEDIHFMATFSLTTGKITACRGVSKRGQKLCKWLKPE